MDDQRSLFWAEQTREDFSAWAAKGAVVIVPIGSIEQHGRHLPVDTDCHTVVAVSRLAARAASDVPVLITPLLPLGISPHHMMYGGGTLSLQVETVIHMVSDVCASIVAHGFERIVLLSGHGGNRNTLQAAALELKHRHQRQIEALCWWDLAPDVWDAVREGPAVTIGHSGEMETSVMLALVPDTVRLERRELVPGISDDPNLATAAKGERVVQATVATLADYLRALAARPGREVVGIETVRG